MNARAKIWILGYLILIFGSLAMVGINVIIVDPFFHYHKPYTDKYYYILNNQRSQNDGISKHFDYDGLITGTSMVENFKTSEMDALFGTNSIKAPYSGGTYKEINDNLKNALLNNPDLKMIIRGLDMGRFLDDKDVMRSDLGEYPVYLYDSNFLNDVKYVFNRDVIFKRVWPMIAEIGEENFKSGITSFDEYSYWGTFYTYGLKTVCPDGVWEQKPGNPVHLSDKECEKILDAVHQNITSLTEEYSDVTFYYFFTPHSIVWWKALVDNGTVYKQIEAEKIIIEEILKCNNIKLYSFNMQTNIITDLNNFKDRIHYGPWINSLMLKYMKDGKCLLTLDNYEQYIEKELIFYNSYDYSQVNEQEDYENDYYAEAILNQEIRGIAPLYFSEEQLKRVELNNASIVYGQHNGTVGFECTGSLQREFGSSTSIEDYVLYSEYVGGRIIVNDIDNYNFLVFYGRKNRDHGQPSVYIFDEENIVLAQYTGKYSELDNAWHQYMIDVSQLSGKVTIIFNGGYTDNTGSVNSAYTFSDIVLY